LETPTLGQRVRLLRDMYWDDIYMNATPIALKGAVVTVLQVEPHIRCQQYNGAAFVYPNLDEIEPE
jgi:hypothetical protein